MKKRKGYYSISVVAKMFSVHQQTIRMYEKQGLISPKRSEGNTRLFSEEDVDRLEEVIYLTHKLGVNLAGVEVILKLQKKIKKMQNDMNKMFDTTHDQLAEQSGQIKDDLKKQATRLVEIKKDTQKKRRKELIDLAPDDHQMSLMESIVTDESVAEPEDDVFDDIEIEYEDK